MPRPWQTIPQYCFHTGGTIIRHHNDIETIMHAHTQYACKLYLLWGSLQISYYDTLEFLRKNKDKKSGEEAANLVLSTVLKHCGTVACYGMCLLLAHLPDATCCQT